jgi:hypothetical protein
MDLNYELAKLKGIHQPGSGFSRSREINYIISPRCIQESIFEATGFKTLMQAMAVSQEQQLPLPAVKLLNAESAQKAKTQPQTSSIQTFEQLFPKK